MEKKVIRLQYQLHIYILYMYVNYCALLFLYLLKVIFHIIFIRCVAGRCQEGFHTIMANGFGFQGFRKRVKTLLNYMRSEQFFLANV